MALASSFWNTKWPLCHFFVSVCRFSIFSSSTLLLNANSRSQETCFQLHVILSDPLTYNIIFDELLIAQKDLLPSQDGGLGPGVICSRARVHGSRHFLLGGLGYSEDYLIGGLQRKKQETWYVAHTFAGYYYCDLLPNVAEGQVNGSHLFWPYFVYFTL